MEKNSKSKQTLNLDLYKYIFSVCIMAVGIGMMILIQPLMKFLIPYGDSGRLIVDELSIRVALYTPKSEDEDVQTIVDDINSAAVVTQNPGLYIIADHGGQEFKNLKECKPGMEAVMRKDKKDEGIKITCSAVFEGKNDTHFLYNSKGTRINDIYSDQVVIYTCIADEGEDVYITIWNRQDNDQKKDISNSNGSHTDHPSGSGMRPER